MYYIVDSAKSFDQAATDLEAAVKRHGFGVLHVHNLGATLRGKGIDFPEQCKVFEVCNPGQAARVLAADMRLNLFEKATKVRGDGRELVARAAHPDGLRHLETVDLRGHHNWSPAKQNRSLELDGHLTYRPGRQVGDRRARVGGVTQIDNVVDVI